MIAGNRVYLRPIIRNDLTCLNRWKNDEDIFKYLGGGFMPISVDHQEKWIDAYMDTTGNNKRYMICEVSTDLPVGMIGLYSINWIHRVCDIGIFVGESDSQGKGYGREACKLLEEYASEYLNLRKIKLDVVSDNKAAIGLWLSLGYQKIGERVEERYIEGKYRNVTLMEKIL